MIHIAIIDDDPKMSAKLSRWMSSKEEMTIVGCFESTEDFLYQINDIDRLDILLLDIELKENLGFLSIKKIKEHLSQLEVIIWSGYDKEDYLFDALRHGASSYILKGAGLSKLELGIHETYRRGSYFDPLIGRKVAAYFRTNKYVGSRQHLTKRELEVVMGLVDGLSYKLIAERLGITIHTVRHFIQTVYKKLEVNSKSEVIALAYKGKIEGINL